MNNSYNPYQYNMKINLTTQSDVIEFVKLAQTIEENVNLLDGCGHCVNAKSLIGCMYSLEFENIYVQSETDKIFSIFDKFSLS